MFVSYFPRSARAQLSLCEMVSFFKILKVAREVWSLIPVCRGRDFVCFVPTEEGLGFRDALIHFMTL